MALLVFIVFCWRYWCLSYFAGVIGVYRILMALLVFIVFCWRYWCLSYFAGVVGVYRS